MKLKERVHHWTSTKTGTVAIVLIGEVVVGLLIFQAGVAFGERRIFHGMHTMMPRGPVPEFGFLSHSFIPQGHGVVGTITNVSLPTFTVATRDGETETVTVSTSTIIRGFPGATEVDLHTGQDVTILGDPENSAEAFTARFINIMTPPPAPIH